MIRKWLVQAKGPQGLYYEIDPAAPIGAAVPCQGYERRHQAELVLERLVDDGDRFKLWGTVELEDVDDPNAPAKRRLVGAGCLVSSPPHQPGLLETNPPDDFREWEQWTAIDVPETFNVGATVRGYVNHHRDGRDFAVTLVTFEILEALL